MNPNDAATVAQLLSEAKQHHQNGDLQQAQALYQRTLELRSEHPEALNYLGLIALQARRPSDAAGFVQRAINADPRNPVYYLNLVHALVALRRMDDAIAAAKEAVALQPAAPEAHDILGRLYLELNRHAQAVDAFKHAVGLRPDFPEACNNLGVALEKLSKHADAAAAYRRALETRPDYAEAANNLGNVLQSMDEPDEALEVYRRAAELSPDSAEIHANIGHVLQGRCEVDEAMTAYRFALERDPNFAGARYLLATAHLNKAELEEALRETELCLQHVPHHQEALALKAILLRELGRDQAALELVDLERFVRIERLATPPGYSSLGQFNQDLQKYIFETETLLRDPAGASTRKGRHSGDILIQPRGPAEVLKGMLQNVFRNYLQALPVDPSHPFLSRVPGRVRLVAQANILDSSGYLVPHIHPYAWASGAYYVRIPDEVNAEDGQHAGWLEIGRPPSELPARVAPALRQIQPEEGIVVLFPSYFYHGTIPFEGKKHRVSLGLDVLAEH